MSTNVYKVGDELSGAEALGLPEGSVVKGSEQTGDRGCTAIRISTGWHFLTKDGRANDIRALYHRDYEVLYVAPTPEAPLLDLTDRDTLALELRRRRTGNPDSDLGAWVDEYRRQADWVLENFEPKAPKVGDRVKVTAGSRVGEYGVVSEDQDEDGDYYIQFEGDLFRTYVHRRNLIRVVH